MKYKLLVWTLRFVAFMAKAGWGNCAQGILADAEGDSKYWMVRRPPTKAEEQDDLPWDWDSTAKLADWRER